MNIATELEKTADIKSEWNGEPFTFSVRVSGLTPQFLQAYEDQKNNRPIELATALASVVTGWDVNLNDESFPPTVENLSKLPTKFLYHLVSKMDEVWSGNEQPPAN